MEGFVMLNSQDCVQTLIDAAGGMDIVQSWFNWRTFKVEARARSAVEDYGSLLFDNLSDLANLGATAEQQQEWRASFIKKWLAYQHAGARTMNWMITGPARFPVAQNEKRMATERKRYDELDAFVSNSRNWLRRRQRSAERAVISEQAKGEIFSEEVVCGVRMVRNTALDRVQLLFPDKPDAETRAQLKKSGFRWSPREGAWQRQLTRNGLWAAQGFLAGYAADHAESLP
jgi:hypothetical protein